MEHIERQTLDLVWGIRGIATLIGRTDRQTYRMLVEGKIPARQIGERWVASRSEIERFFRSEAA